MGKLWNFFLNVVSTAVALWVVVKFVPGIDFAAPVSTFLIVAALFILVHSVAIPFLRVIGAPLTCLTFGLFSLVIEASALYIVSWLVKELDLGALEIRNLWAAIIGAVVLGLVSGLVNIPLKVRR